LPARKPTASDNRCDASPLETLERTLVEARETVIREQAAVIAGLSAEAARLRAALEILNEGVAVCDADGRLQLCNRRFAEIYGLGPDEVRPGVSVQQLTLAPPGDCAAPDASAETAAPTGASAKTRARTAALPDGRFVEINEAPAPGGGWISTHRDVGERGALADERLSLQKLIDLVPDNLWLKDAGSRFLIANHATARRMGYASSDNLIGKTDLELCPAETAQKYFADERGIVESGEAMVDCEEYVIAGDGGTC
jgi:PAS domain S-box-containing protein